MAPPRRPYGDNSLFTLRHEHGRVGPVLLDSVGPPDGYEQFDVGVVEFDDDGRFAHGAQLQTLRQRIAEVRKQNDHGAIVVCFIHGWHNNAEWGNPNFVSFRRLLEALMWRELEALHRRVIGVYLGWNGQPVDVVGQWISRIPVARHTSFRDRYDAAGDIGKGEELATALVELTAACKDGADTQTPLILVGHSMGAYILQTAVRELLRNDQDPLIRACDSQGGPVTISADSGSDLAMPDLMLSMNSAAESEVARDIIAFMGDGGWRKRFDPSRIMSTVVPYEPPLLISMTSTKDTATNWVWRLGHFLEKPSTDGHDPTLATHRFERSDAPADCAAAGFNDYGQPWHCLHKDRQPVPTPRFRIDLPDHDRLSGQALTHTAYDLIPHRPDTGAPFWLFQVPGEIIADHNDIFNYRSASLVLALIQAAGVLASAAGTRWEDNFSETDLG
ncbi:MAG: hypothetical protein WBM50_21575 [Acidimicrobiales bacterium]